MLFFQLPRRDDDHVQLQSAVFDIFHLLPEHLPVLSDELDAGRRLRCLYTQGEGKVPQALLAQKEGRPVLLRPISHQGDTRKSQLRAL